QQEFLASPTTESVGGAYRSRGDGGEFLQHAIAGRVPELVVERLEAVQVDECNTERLLLLECRRERLRRHCRHAAAIAQPRQAVPGCQSKQLLAVAQIRDQQNR